MKLSIVATLYQSASFIKEFHERASASAKRMVGDDYEIVLVNDGSPDNSRGLAIKLTEQDSHVVVVDLSRNFGHHKAILEGLRHARGEQIFLIDSDLEEEPEWLLTFREKMTRDGCDVVYGVQLHRKGGWFERWSGIVYYKVLCSLLEITLPENVLTARLMTRRFVDALLQFDEREVFLGGLFSHAGFDQVPVVVRKHSSSETTYSFKRKIVLLFDSITAFSNLPLVLIFYFGLLISLFATGYVAYITINWLFYASPPSGWTSVVASIWLLGGIMISFLGVIGIYLSKIYIETKRRPSTIVRRIYGCASK